MGWIYNHERWTTSGISLQRVSRLQGHEVFQELGRPLPSHRERVDYSALLRANPGTCRGLRIMGAFAHVGGYVYVQSMAGKFVPHH